MIWAAGNMAARLLKTLARRWTAGASSSSRDCTIPGHPEVFVLGDAAALRAGWTPLPGVCPAAIQMGGYAAAAIGDDLAGRPREPFRYCDKGPLAVIGRGQAVADIGGSISAASSPGCSGSSSTSSS